MKIPTLPFTLTDWSSVEPVRYPGETGYAEWRTLEVGDIRIRVVEYSPGYLADHWCDRGPYFVCFGRSVDQRVEGRTERRDDAGNELSGFGLRWTRHIAQRPKWARNFSLSTNLLSLRNHIFCLASDSDCADP